MSKRMLVVAGLVVLVGVAAGAAVVASRDAEDRSCERGGLERDSGDGKLVVVRRDLPDQGSIIDRARYYACDTASGRRVELDEVVSNEGDIESTATFSVVADRWVVQQVDSTGPEIDSSTSSPVIILRDGRTGDWLHDNQSCEEEMTGYKVLSSGHLAVACDRLLLYAPADGPGEKLAPPGAEVRDLSVDEDGRTLRWTERRDGERVDESHPVD
ncbi:MAG: hypothetical protein H0V42_10500 [Nocardioidaceae bacterium]|nr:hypothetical protein [Nocardioidaceae bacterium]